MTESEVKEKLSYLLSQENLDYSAILSLSNRLSQFDKGNVRFSVDAGVIDRLGNELVSRQETAVSELVKNSYDADATYVKLTFINSNETGGTLVIEDSGVGMTKEQLINGFMRISSTDKVRNPYSDLYNRKRAGKKGIGRFAVQRLGRNLSIITKSINEDCAYKLSIDWDEYVGEKDLIDITNTIEEINYDKIFGTILRIENLRDKWTEAAIKRIYRYVSDIMQPFPLSNNNTEGVDPGFKAIFYISDGISKRKIVDDKIMIYDHAVAVIDGYVDSHHKAGYSVVSSKLGIDFSDDIGIDPDNKYSLFDKIKNVKFRAYYYIYEGNLIPKMHLNAIRKLANVAGGIRLYRNGFRVLPYGEPGDDWLSLDMSTRRRSILPTHTNISFFGFVEIDDSSGDFEETSSREGLMNNDAMIQLQNFTYRAILNSVIKIAEVRNIKVVSGQKKDEKGNWEKIDIRVKNIAHTLDELDKALETDDGVVAKKQRRKKIAKLKKDLEEVDKLQKQEISKTLKERSMLRVLGSVGLTIGQFIHEIKYHFDNIKDDINVLIQDLQDNYKALERLCILNDNFASFSTYMSYFDNVISLNIVRELRPIELRTVVKPFIESMYSDAIKAGIELLPAEFIGYNLYTKPMHPSEWSSILFNFYTNSKKAIKRHGSFGQIHIECGATDKYIYLEFSDTGDGISPEDEDRIFDEFYTTTSQNSLDSLDYKNQIEGTGLGLKIVKDIVLSYKGNIMVVSPKQHYSTCIRVEIPKANDKDLESII